MHRDDLFLEFVRVVERAAIAAARTMGQGDRKYADQVAVDAMRKEMESVDIDGTIVIGEGERDEAPMLYVGEKVGKGGYPVDIAGRSPGGHQPLRHRAPQRDRGAGRLREGRPAHAPDIYMEKLVVGPSSKGKVDINAPVEDNLKVIAKSLDREVHDLVVIVLDRPRHERLIADIRKAGARIRLIGDGDLSAGISAAVVGPVCTR
jgi:fructose-1,6-bisphosphatase/sedoheptulose 1,7-bisphosphatase-like protein